eukprot:TRINITY_DN1167_c0_g1_i4.p1 TRINITY_DN1167_c0_g1~~TRINITY_DN1167_c0_g1_i4.p1  ORF type:complete len:230 (-),score=16.88 TRINITY_DN1167_c0_g1_i4:94-783(-)
MLLLVLIHVATKHGLKLDASHVHPNLLNVFVLQLAFLEALGICILVTDSLKVFEGRKRPNFFAMCNYKGYRDALESGNWDTYLAQTTPGVSGNMTHCLETDQAILRDSQYSFPSGHSSTIWCGFTFLAQTVLYLAHRYSPDNSMGKGIVGLLFFAVAAVVAGTRPRDYWHNFDDVLAGSIIGAASASLAFSINYSEVSFKSYKKAIKTSNETLDFVPNETMDLMGGYRS